MGCKVVPVTVAALQLAERFSPTVRDRCRQLRRAASDYRKAFDAAALFQFDAAFVGCRVIVGAGFAQVEGQRQLARLKHIVPAFLI